METEPAPAKINLTLHVTGRRADGYHLLDSLVVFTGLGDRVTACPAPAPALSVIGPFAQGIPVDDSNLVLRAARQFGVTGAALTLEKNLPMASGIGGGSSDAAATLRALSRMTGRALPAAHSLTSLGADVPACLDPRARRMRGLGEGLTDVPPLPPLWLVLVNPGVPLATPAVFAALRRRDGPPMPQNLPRCATAADLAGFLRSQRNDLEPAARSLAPVIDIALSALKVQPGCLVARMSGSGATCFGLFPNPQSAATAARAIAATQPGWWVRDTCVL